MTKKREENHDSGASARIIDRERDGVHLPLMPLSCPF